MGKSSFYSKASVLIKTLALLTSLSTFLSFLTSCRPMTYNTKLFDNIEDCLDNDFIMNNHVDLIGDTDYPVSRFFIIHNYEEYEEIFVDNAIDIQINFNTQMIILYTFGTTSHRNCYLIDLSVKNDCLYVTYTKEIKFFVGDASMPYQRWFALTIDKLSIETVVFEEKVFFRR